MQLLKMIYWPSKTRRGWRIFFAVKPIVRNKATVFTLGNRNCVINTDLESPIIVTHAAEEKNEKFLFESLFRSMQYALFGNASSEYLFLGDFFMTSGQAASDLFHAVMGKSLKILVKSVETYVACSFDCIALLLCLHIVYRYQNMLHKRDIKVLDGYWEALIRLLWCRFESVFAFNLDSVRNLEVLKIAVSDSRPHYIIRRYAEFSSALASINASWPDERVQQMLQQMQIDADNLLNRLAASADFKEPLAQQQQLVGGGQSKKSAVSSSQQQLHTDKKRKLIFLINNYDLILTTFGLNLTEETTESAAFQELLQARTSEYIEELLFIYFGPLVTFIVECERLIDQGHHESLKRHVDKIPLLIKSFGNSWKKSIEQINQEVITSFSSLKQGSNVLQNALTQLIQYYHRFQKVLSCPTFVTCPARNDLVNIHHIMVEVKKYKPVF